MFWASHAYHFQNINKLVLKHKQIVLIVRVYNMVAYISLKFYQIFQDPSSSGLSCKEYVHINKFKLTYNQWGQDKAEVGEKGQSIINGES